MRYEVIDPTPTRLKVARRLLARTIEKPDGCLEMTGCRTSGYVFIRAFGSSRTAHLVSFDLFSQRHVASPSIQVHHKCENKACVNPDHLELLTPAEHVRRHVSPVSINAAKTHCVHGHEFTPENTYVHQKRGVRKCMACHRRRDSEFHRKPEVRERDKEWHRLHRVSRAKPVPAGIDDPNPGRAA